MPLTETFYQRRVHLFYLSGSTPEGSGLSRLILEGARWSDQHYHENEPILPNRLRLDWRSRPGYRCSFRVRFHAAGWRCRFRFGRTIPVQRQGPLYQKEYGLVFGIAITGHPSGVCFTPLLQAATPARSGEKHDGMAPRFGWLDLALDFSCAPLTVRIMMLWTFRPVIGASNIRAKPPENHVNISSSEPSDLLMNGWGGEDTMNPFVNPKKRGVSLPSGCKDLIDVLQRRESGHDSAVRRFIHLVYSRRSKIRPRSWSSELLRRVEARRSDTRSGTRGMTCRRSHRTFGLMSYLSLSGWRDFTLVIFRERVFWTRASARFD